MYGLRWTKGHFPLLQEPHVWNIAARYSTETVLVTHTPTSISAVRFLSDFNNAATSTFIHHFQRANVHVTADTFNGLYLSNSVCHDKTTRHFIIIIVYVIVIIIIKLQHEGCFSLNLYF